MMVSQILLVASFILFVLATFKVAAPKVDLTAAGLACVALAQLLRTL